MRLEAAREREKTEMQTKLVSVAHFPFGSGPVILRYKAQLNNRVPAFTFTKTQKRAMHQYMYYHLVLFLYFTRLFDLHVWKKRCVGNIQTEEWLCLPERNL